MDLQGCNFGKNSNMSCKLKLWIGEVGFGQQSPCKMTKKCEAKTYDGRSSVQLTNNLVGTHALEMVSNAKSK